MGSWHSLAVVSLFGGEGDSSNHFDIWLLSDLKGYKWDRGFPIFDPVRKPLPLSIGRPLTELTRQSPGWERG